MFSALTFGLCLLAVLNAHFLDDLDVILLFHINAFLLVGMGAFSSGSMRDRSVLFAAFIWEAWVLATDQLSYFPSWLAASETVAFVFLVGWVYFRQYEHLQAPIKPSTVCIGFYGGDNAPILSFFASIFGFPFSSVAVCVGDVATRPSKSRGIMVQTTKVALEKKGYIFIPTNVYVNAEMIGTLNKICGEKTGYGFMRTKCVTNLKPLLALIGPQWTPTLRATLPGVYYRQCVKAAV